MKGEGKHIGNGFDILRFQIQTTNTDRVTEVIWTVVKDGC